MSRLLLLRGVIGAGKTTVGRLLEARGDGVRVVEVDTVKETNRGDAADCVPEEDFPEAGRRARELLDRGFDVVGIEFFADREHVEWFLGGAGRALGTPDVSSVWLDCDLEEAVRRKADERSRSIVELQHRRHEERFFAPGELVLDTARLPPETVAARIETWWRESGHR